MTVTAEYAIELGRQLDELEAENAQLREREAQARTLILAAPLYMPTVDDAWGSDRWRSDAKKWLESES